MFNNLTDLARAFKRAANARKRYGDDVNKWPAGIRDAYIMAVRINEDLNPTKQREKPNVSG